MFVNNRTNDDFKLFFLLSVLKLYNRNIFYNFLLTCHQLKLYGNKERDCTLAQWYMLVYLVSIARGI